MSQAVRKIHSEVFVSVFIPARSSSGENSAKAVKRWSRSTEKKRCTFEGVWARTSQSRARWCRKATGTPTICRRRCMRCRCSGSIARARWWHTMSNANPARAATQRMITRDDLLGLLDALPPEELGDLLDELGVDGQVAAPALPDPSILNYYRMNWAQISPVPVQQ